MIKVQIEYQVNGAFGFDASLDDLASDLADTHGAIDGGSGSGFGFRDLDFDFDDEVKAELFYRQVKERLSEKLDSKFFNVALHTYEELDLEEGEL